MKLRCCRCCGVCFFNAVMRAVIKIPPFGFAVITNPTVFDVCVSHASVFGETKLFCGLLEFLV